MIDERLLQVGFAQPGVIFEVQEIEYVGILDEAFGRHIGELVVGLGDDRRLVFAREQTLVVQNRYLAIELTRDQCSLAASFMYQVRAAGSLTFMSLR